jgi:hypothetical protein
MRDLSGINQEQGWSIFLPAISSFYSNMIGRYREDNNYYPHSRIPKGFENGVEGLNFLDPEKGYYYYDSALYSAGHAYLDLTKSQKFDYMMYERDRKKTTLVGDSGGFQIGKGVINFDWGNFFEKKGDPGYVGKADTVRMNILRWLEATAEWSMTLDVPSWACVGKNRELTGLKTFDECLKATIHNNDFFVQNRTPGATKFLNVLQGSNKETSDIWYDAVKDYDFEGWAFGGTHTLNMIMFLRRLIVMRDEGKLEGRDWIHVLGNSRLDWACALTAIQRQLRKTANKNITISFDCASPFIATAKGLAYNMNVFENKRFSYLMSPFVDNKSFKGSSIPLPFESPISDRLNMGDICCYGPGDLNKLGKEGKSSWDTLSYAMLMSHNTYNHIRSVQIANSYVDMEYQNNPVDFRDWKKAKKNDKSGEVSDFVPRKILYFVSFVEELFKSSNPMSMIEDNTLFLNEFVNAARTTNHVFDCLFDEVPQVKDDSGFSEDDDSLDILEKSIHDDV